MFPGDTVVMNHPNGYAEVTGRGGEFVAWVPNGIRGVIYVLTPEKNRAVVHFDGKLIATVAREHLQVLDGSTTPGRTEAMDQAAI